MKCAVLESPGKIRIADMDIPKIKDNEVLVKVQVCGICGSDRHAYCRGHPRIAYPIILGHEFSGTIVDSKSREINAGDRVVIDPNIACNACDECRSGRRHLCKNLKSIGINMQGAYAEYVAVPLENVYKIPEGLSMEEAAMTEPLACVLHAIDQISIRPGDNCLILGAGPIGLMFAMLFHNFGYNPVIISEISEERLKFAKKYGTAFNPENMNIRDMMKDQSIDGFNIIIDAAGNVKALEEAISIMAPAGKLMVFALYPEDVTPKLSLAMIYKKEISIFSDFTNPYTMKRALNLISSGTIDIRSLITSTTSLRNVEVSLKRDTGIETLISIGK